MYSGKLAYEHRVSVPEVLVDGAPNLPPGRTASHFIVNSYVHYLLVSVNVFFLLNAT